MFEAFMGTDFSEVFLDDQRCEYEFEVQHYGTVCTAIVRLFITDILLKTM